MIRKRKNNKTEVIGMYVPTTTVVPTPESGDRVYGETPTGIKNGSNNVFTTLYDFVPETVQVLVNGIIQKKSGYVTSGLRTVTMVVSPLSSDSLEINYTRL